MAQNPTAESLNIPPTLLEQVKAAAAEEHRPMEEVLCEAVERYLRERRWQKLFVYGEERARELGLSGSDIPRLIAEYRHERGESRR